MSQNRNFERFASPNGSALNQPSDTPSSNSLEEAEREIFGGDKPVRKIRVPDNALIPRGDGEFVYKRFVMTSVGMEMPDDATNDELIEVGYILDQLGESVQWNSADWFNRAENRVWGQMYQQPADEVLSPDTILKYQTLADYAWVARHVQFSIRNRKLSFAHHRVIAPLNKNADLQKLWLEYAVSRLPKRLTVEGFKRELRSLELLTTDEQYQWLNWALSQPQELLSKQPELKPTALLPPPQISAAVINAQKKVGRSFNRFKSYTQGNLNLSKADLDREGKAIIEWVQKVMNSK